MSSGPPSAAVPPVEPSPHRVRSDAPFLAGLTILGGFYVLLVVALIVANATYTTADDLWRTLSAPEIRYATKLSLFTSLTSTIFSLWVAVPIGYLMSRYRFPGKLIVDAVLDIPIVLPPLVIGLSLLILFKTAPGAAVESGFEWLTDKLFGRPLGFVFEIPGIVLAQFMVAAAFAVRTLRTAFDEITPRKEQVALTLGCTRGQAFWMVVLPEARRGVLAAATLTWARSIGEFGPVLIFSGATRFKTEVLPTTVFLELSVGNLEGAVAVSLLMVVMALIVLVVVRFLGRSDPLSKFFR